MRVDQILKSKASQTLTTVASTDSLAQAVDILSTQKIGALVVTDDGKKLKGILSERDIVRELGKSGAAFLEKPVSSLMTVHPVTCRRDDGADDVMTLMTNGRFRHLPVLELGELVGMISIGDVVKARLDQLSTENQAMAGMIAGHG